MDGLRSIQCIRSQLCMGGPIFHIASRTSVLLCVCVCVFVCMCEFMYVYSCCVSAFVAHTHSDCTCARSVYSPVATACLGSVMCGFVSMVGWGVVVVGLQCRGCDVHQKPLPIMASFPTPHISIPSPSSDIYFMTAYISNI